MLVQNLFPCTITAVQVNQGSDIVRGSLLLPRARAANRPFHRMEWLSSGYKIAGRWEIWKGPRKINTALQPVAHPKKGVLTVAAFDGKQFFRLTEKSAMRFIPPNFRATIKKDCLICMYLAGFLIFPLFLFSQPQAPNQVFVRPLNIFSDTIRLHYDQVRLDSLITASIQKIISNDSLHNRQTSQQIQSITTQREHWQRWSYLLLSAIIFLISYLIVKPRLDKAPPLREYPDIDRNPEYTDLEQAESEISKYTTQQLSVLWLSN